MIDLQGELRALSGDLSGALVEKISIQTSYCCLMLWVSTMSYFLGSPRLDDF